MYTKDFGDHVPLYGQGMFNWCGPASAQMSRNGYPQPSDRLLYAQLAMWNSIQFYNSTDINDAGAGWATDPHGLQGCLQAADNPEGVHWEEFANPDQEQLLFSTLYWMNNRGFPAPTLIHEGGHWVVIVGWTTDVEPVRGSSPMLQSIHYYDPEPDGVGSDITMTAHKWNDTAWDAPVLYSGTWFEKYVAILEPPTAKGVVRVKPTRRSRPGRLKPPEAVAKAKAWIAQQGFAAMPRYSVLGRRDVEALTPLLVRQEPPVPPAHGRGVRPRRRGPAGEVSSYYVVPFGISGERSSTGAPLARVCVLVDASTGAFEEVAAFGRPVSHLTKEEALNVVGASLRLTRRQLGKTEATLMFRPGAITHIRAYPFWQVRLGHRTLYVDQLGKLYGRLMPATPGD